MKNTNKKALKAMLILAMLVTLCMSLAACAQTTETGTTDPIVLELVNVGLDILAKVRDDDREMDISPAALAALYE